MSEQPAEPVQPAYPQQEQGYTVPQEGYAHTQDASAYEQPQADVPQHVTADQPGDVHPASIAGDPPQDDNAQDNEDGDQVQARADEPATTEPVPVVLDDQAAAAGQVRTAPVTMAEATAGEDNLSSVTVHPGVLVRLADVYAHVENWFARHPEVSRVLGAELKSAIGTAERVNSGGGYAPVGNVPVQAPEPPAPTA
jgi:hypothetical protein